MLKELSQSIHINLHKIASHNFESVSPLVCTDIGSWIWRDILKYGTFKSTSFSVENNNLEVQINREHYEKYMRKYSIPVVEEAGEGTLTARLLDVLLAVFCLCLKICNFNAGGCLNFQAHLHLLHTEALQAGLALPDAGHRLNTSS